MRTLKEEWLRLMNLILYSQQTEHVEDYIEIRNAQISFSLSNNVNELQ